MKEYKFSIIMAIYNVKGYLEDAILSVIGQTIGFEESVELILVNDGSTDGSGALCEEIKAKFPNNIVVLHQNNCGISAARNRGISVAKGKIFGFLDPDDKLSNNVLEKAATFFDEHEYETDVVSVPIFWFGEKSGAHLLNNKFQSGNRVISLEAEPECIQLSISSAFIKREAMPLRNNPFDERLVVAEDAKLLQEILSQKRTLGVLEDCIYWYRRRNNRNKSALQKAVGSKPWYDDHIRYFAFDTLNNLKSTFGTIPRFVQFAVMYDIQWRLIELTKENYPEQFNFEDYRSWLIKCLQNIDAEIILSQKSINSALKRWLMCLKYGQTCSVKVEENNIISTFERRFCVNEEIVGVDFDFITWRDGYLEIEGRINLPANISSSEVLLCWNLDWLYPVQTHPASTLYKSTYILKDNLSIISGFKIELPVTQNISKYEGTFWWKYEASKYKLKLHDFGKFCPIGKELQTSYYKCGCWILAVKHDTLFLKKANCLSPYFKEARFLAELVTCGRSGIEAAFLRIISALIKKLLMHPIWLISDRIDRADDNGEAFFKFLTERKEPIHVRFLLRKTSYDWSRLKQFGKIIKYFSIRHKLCHLSCQYIVSSQADHFTMNPFGDAWFYYRDIQSHIKFIFLQHGVAKDDLSDWLNRYKKNIYGLVVSAQRERDSIQFGKYDYNKHNIWLTGLCRFDLLYHNEKRYITIMPTWRKYLMGSFSTETASRTLSTAFEDSEYYNFYHSLLNDQRLLKAAEQYKYTICFRPHPLMMPHIGKFAIDKQVLIFPVEKPYRDIFAESNLLVTDFSSVAFDFAYLNKPVLYCRPDTQEFISGKHVYKPGYYIYEDDGFGEVTFSVNETVDQVISYMKEECNLRTKYANRITNFFTYVDKNNRLRLLKRLYEEN